MEKKKIRTGSTEDKRSLVQKRSDALLLFQNGKRAYLTFRGVSMKRTEAVASLIDQKYDKMYAVCEKANALLN